MYVVVLGIPDRSRVPARPTTVQGKPCCRCRGLLLANLILGHPLPPFARPSPSPRIDPATANDDDATDYGGSASSTATVSSVAELQTTRPMPRLRTACQVEAVGTGLDPPSRDSLSAEESVKRTYLRKWLKDNTSRTLNCDLSLIGSTTIERLGSVIQKLITIPAVMQKVANPVPRVRHLDWLHRRVAGAVDKFKQNKVTDFFKVMKALQAQQTRPRDIEDFGNTGGRCLAVVTKKNCKTSPEPEEDIFSR
ncbi:hypothetical protein DFH07DRAFT_978095 [Mycena maculata]|uniref:DNA polymerase epsilon catalytic subunit n=1 Tax=Mycena maculata TaxID=230809 RepID=A0AAD7ILA1_9AGAR|nr:hypothetical protein DFH07DRAFT_978095 [Mycena maculata]